MLYALTGIAYLLWLIDCRLLNIALRRVLGYTAQTIYSTAAASIKPLRRMLLARPSAMSCDDGVMTEQPKPECSPQLVVPLYKARVCKTCGHPRDANAFASAKAKKCLACQPLARSTKMNVRKPGRHRLWTAQCNRVRTELRKALQTGCEPTRDLLGCHNAEEMWAHVQPKLLDGMTEDNYGEWHVDHVTPIAVFDLSKSDHRARCFNVANMAPMWAVDNMAKATSLQTLNRKIVSKPKAL